MQAVQAAVRKKGRYFQSIFRRRHGSEYGSVDGGQNAFRTPILET